MNDDYSELHEDKEGSYPMSNPEATNSEKHSAKLYEELHEFLQTEYTEDELRDRLQALSIGYLLRIGTLDSEKYSRLVVKVALEVTKQKANVSQIITTTDITYEEFDFSWLKGLFIINVIYYEQSSSWHFLISAKARLIVDCLWRISENNLIRYTNEDHGVQYGLPEPIDAVVEAKQLLENKLIEKVDLQEGSLDLTLFLEKNIRLEIIPNSSGYENWQLTDPRNRSFVAAGGRVSTWQN